MNWLVLALSSPIETGPPAGLKIAQAPESRWTAVAIASSEKSGAGDGNRTHDMQLGKLPFYH